MLKLIELMNVESTNLRYLTLEVIYSLCARNGNTNASVSMIDLTCE